MSTRTTYFLAFCLIAIATGLRIWALPTLPAGFSDQELTHITVVRDDIKQGNIRVFYERDGRGQEGLYHTGLALTSAILGEGLFGLRLSSVFVGVITLALLFSLGTRLLGPLGGLAALGFSASTLWGTLLSRLVLVETVLPLLVIAVILGMARAMPVYRRSRAEATNTIAFAAMGLSLGLGLYVHPVGLLLVLAAMIYITYLVMLRRPLSLRRLSYIGFAILLLLISAVPYFISTLRLPELNAGTRIMGEYQGLIVPSFINKCISQGDSFAK